MEYDIYRYPCLKEFSLFSMKQVFKTVSYTHLRAHET